MKFLTQARVPALDGYLSGENQSLLVEAIFWTSIFIAYSNLLSRLVRSVSNHLPWWNLSKKRGGVLCGNGQDDSILFLVLALHHGLAGFLMTKGVINDNPITWRHGYLLESGYEIADLLAIIFNMYPYRRDGVKPDVKVAFCFHHLPGIILSAFVLEAGLHYNEHLRNIGMWLLLGACQSCLGGVYIYCLDFSTQMKHAAIANLVNVGFFFYCRMIVFPTESYLLIRDVQSSEEFSNHPYLLKLLYFGGICLTLFNVGILADCIPKAIRYCKRSIDGTTPIELEPVPKARADRRRSSLGMVVDVVDEVVARRRSSFETIMHLNAVEDVARLNREAEEDRDLSAEDLAALKKTVSSMSEKSLKVE